MENKFSLVLTRGRHKHLLIEKKQSLICSWISEVQKRAFILRGLCPFSAFKLQDWGPVEPREEASPRNLYPLLALLTAVPVINNPEAEYINKQIRLF